jgi:hypothetical protein
MNRSLVEERDSNYLFSLASAFRNESYGYITRYTFQTEPFPNFRATFLSRSRGNSTLFTYRTGLFRLIEHNDSIPLLNSTHGYNFTGSKGKWSAVRVSRNKTNEIEYVNVTSCLNDTVRVCFYGYLPSQPISSESMNLNTGGFKFSLRISDYKYKLSNSMLSLAFWVQTKDVANMSAQGLKVGLGGSFDYVPYAYTSDTNLNEAAKIDITAQVAKLTLPSISSTAMDNNRVVGENSVVIAFNFNAPQPSTIFWDPSLTINEAELALNDTLLGPAASKSTSPVTAGNSAGVMVTFAWTLCLPNLVLFLYFLM